MQDKNFVELVKELVKENVLILCTGCAVGQFRTTRVCLHQRQPRSMPARGLKAVLTALGQCGRPERAAADGAAYRLVRR